ncbi:MAG: AAA family ATPase [Clostridium cadaveris]|uniref:ATP-dependent nuclease n=1 Tax=Clostridium cadaveris TaxID=1529 RepID=UPI002A8E65B3|nr:AAA family ATPase [Clostridium cadaveris]
MNFLELEIKNIKNIKEFSLEIPLERGIYGIVGPNGCGKSTIMLALSQLVRKSSLKKLNKLDFNMDSIVKFSFNGYEDNYYFDYQNEKWVVTGHPPILHFDGFYEGSIFYGTRFIDSQKAELIMDELQNNKDIVDADDFIIEKLGEIMHDDKNYYKNLKKFKNMTIAKKYGFSRMPYFYMTENGLISQLAMSSGECMVITMLHFVYYIVVKENYNKKNKIIFLIDEVELALHPSAIDRLIKLINGLIVGAELVCIFSSHSAEVIRKINPKNLFHIENNEGALSVVNPCYPSYAIRDLYTQDGFDFLLLVEDELAKKIVNEIIMENNLFDSKLIHVLPCGDWYNNLKLHNDIMKNNVLGVGKVVISILDGDVIDEVMGKENFKHLKKLFLPVKSVEKYLYEKLISNVDHSFVKFLGDKYFRTRSLQDIIVDYRTNFNVDKDSNGKKLYSVLISNMYKAGIDEDQFLNYFCRDIRRRVDTEKFEKSLEKSLL